LTKKENPTRELKLGFKKKSCPVPVGSHLGTGPGPVWFQVKLFSKPGVGFETILELDPACLPWVLVPAGSKKRGLVPGTQNRNYQFLPLIRVPSHHWF